MNEEEFDLMLATILERPVEEMTDDELETRISMTQAATDRLLNELEGRGLIALHDGAPVIPCDIPDSRFVETILTRDGPRHTG